MQMGINLQKESVFGSQNDSLTPGWISPCMDVLKLFVALKKNDECIFICVLILSHVHTFSLHTKTYVVPDNTLNVRYLAQLKILTFTSPDVSTIPGLGLTSLSC